MKEYLFTTFKLSKIFALCAFALILCSQSKAQQKTPIRGDTILFKGVTTTDPKIFFDIDSKTISGFMKNIGDGKIAFAVPVISDVSGLQTALNSKLNISDTANMLAPYSLSTHTHVINNITGLQNALDGKINISDTASMLSPYALDADVSLKLNISDTANMLTPYSLDGHTHVIADVTGLQTAINSKLNISDTASMLNPYLRKADTTTMLSPYLRKTDTTSLSNRINLKVNIADTANMLADYINKADTASMLSPYALDTDISTLSGNIALKLNISDTANMLAPYLKEADTVSLSNRINLKVNIADTANMLTDYINKADTASMLSPYLRKTDTTSLSNRINTKLNISDTSVFARDTEVALKVNISDTANMLAPYLREADTSSLSTRINAKVNISDTANMLAPYLKEADTTSLSNRINLKINISDTASMLTDYINKADTASMLLPYALDNHSHVIADVTGLQTALNSKLNISDTASMLSPYALDAHFHAGEDITSGTIADARLSTNVALENTPNVFTTIQNITRVSIGSTITDALVLENTTAAANGVQQFSPAIHWGGRGWKTDATASSQNVDWRAYASAVQGTANPTTSWILASSINGGSYTNRLIIDASDGALTAAYFKSTATPTSGSTADSALYINRTTGAFEMRKLAAGAVDATPTNGSSNPVSSDGVFDALALKLNISDTGSMLSPYATDAQVALKVNISDTATMLAPYLKEADTSSLSNRINTKVNISDTANMLTDYINKADTASMLSPYALDADLSSYATLAGANLFTNNQTITKTTEQLRIRYDASNYYTTVVGSTGGVTFDATGSGAAFTFSDNVTISGTITNTGLTNALNAKLNIADTANMLDPYATQDALDDTAFTLRGLIAAGGIDVDAVPTNGSSNAVSSDGVFDALALKLNISDTTSMLNPYATDVSVALKLNISDTASMLTDYINKADTANMLSSYLLEADTSSLSNRINAKVNISDTATMLTGYAKLGAANTFTNTNEFTRIGVGTTPHATNVIQLAQGGILNFGNTNAQISSPNSTQLNVGGTGITVYSGGSIQTGGNFTGSNLVNASGSSNGSLYLGSASAPTRLERSVADAHAAFRIEQGYTNASSTGNILEMRFNQTLKSSFDKDGNLVINNSFAPTSGSTAFNTISLTPTINQTGGANGTIRGLHINPTLTALGGIWLPIDAYGGFIRHTRDGIGTGEATGIEIRNSTLATAVLNQNSPSLTLTGNAWKSDAVATSQTVQWQTDVQAVSGTSIASSIYRFRHLVGGSLTGTPMTITSAGAVTLGSITASGNITTTGAIFSPIFSTNTSNTSANFFTSGTSGLSVGSSSTNAALLFGGASTVEFRSIFNGSTATQIAADNSASNVIFGGAAIAENTTGTHAWINNVTINPHAVNSNTATTTNAATLYLGGAPTGGATNNYALYVAGGAANFQGSVQTPGLSGVATAMDSAVVLNRSTGALEIRKLPAAASIDATPTDGSNNAVSSNGVFDALALELNISDTASMLSPYATDAQVNAKLNISDTAAMLTDYINKADTASMLNPYLLEADTASLSTRINSKLNIADTAAMLDAYALLNGANQFTNNQTITKTTEQLRLAYDGSNYYTTVVGNTGIVTYTGAGSGTLFRFQNETQINANALLGGIGVTTATLAVYTASNTTNDARVLFGGASNVRARIFAGQGANNAAVSANESFAHAIIGGTTFVEASSGTHAWGAGLVVRPPTITDGTAATTNSATLYVDGAPTGATNNYAIYSAGGTNHFAGTTYVAGSLIASGGVIQMGNSIGGSNFNVHQATASAPVTTAGLLYGGASTVNVRISEIGNTSTTLGVGNSYAGHVIGQQGLTEAASGTHAWASSLVVRPVSITDAAGTTTNSAALYIDGAASGATNNWALYVAGGTSYFGGSIAAINTPAVATVMDSALVVNRSTGVLEMRKLPTIAGGTGDVTGPASATDNALVRFDNTTGKLVQNSNATLADNGQLSLVKGVDMVGTGVEIFMNETDSAQSTALYALVDGSTSNDLDIRVYGSDFSVPANANTMQFASTSDSMIFKQLRSTGTIQFNIDGANRLSIASSGALKFHNYTTGFLKSDADGDITSSAIAQSDVTGLTTSLNAKLNISDTANMLSTYARKASPTFTGIVTTAQLDVTLTNLGVTQTETGLNLINTSSAAVNAQQISPAIRWKGSGWKTNATAAAQDVEFRAYVLPKQGTANPTGELVFQESINNATYTDVLMIGSKAITQTVPYSEVAFSNPSNLVQFWNANLDSTGASVIGTQVYGGSYPTWSVKVYGNNHATNTDYTLMDATSDTFKISGANIMVFSAPDIVISSHMGGILHTNSSGVLSAVAPSPSASAADSVVYYNRSTGVLEVRLAPSGGTIDATPTDGSNNAVASNGVFDALALKLNISDTASMLANYALDADLSGYAQLSAANLFTNNQTITKTTEQLRVRYDANNYMTTTVASTGSVTFNLVAGSGTPVFNFSDPVVVSTDVEITDATKGVILKSPDGSRWRITVGDDGALTATEL
jgi:hypothetical protein